VNVIVKDVDDTVLVFWGDTPQELIENRDLNNRLDEACDIDRFCCCDWREGIHGNIEKCRIPFKGEKMYMMAIAYNKVYHGFLGMGGGKLSYEIQIDVDNRPILIRKNFVRINTKETGYVGFLELTREGDKIEYKIIEDRSNLDPGVREYLKSIESVLENEADSKTMISTEQM
jgi:hypothetical protein